MRHIWKVGAIGMTLVVAIALLAGCGSSGPSAEEKREAAKRHEQAEQKQAQALALVRGEECEQQLGEFIEALEELDGRLQIGLSYSEYTSELGTVQVAYNRIPIDEMDPRCLGNVGLPTEKAFQEYAAAGETWEECIEALSCGDGISPEVQAEWVKASAKLERATGVGMTEVGVMQPADLVAAEKGVSKQSGP